jgi:hypothetical protein
VVISDLGAFVSTSPQIWERITDLSGAPRDVAFGNGRFVLTGSQSGTYSSTDGRNWQFAVRAGHDKVEYGDGLFVVVDFQGNFRYSTDGTSWVNGPSEDAGFVRKIRYAGGSFYSAGDYLGSSENGIDWIFTNPGVSNLNSFLDVTVAGDRLLLLPVGWPRSYLSMPHLTSNSPITVRILAESPNVGENGSEESAFLVSRTGSPTSELAVNITISGSASNGVDYETISNVIVIPAGASTVEIRFSVFPDTEVEGTETINIAIQPSPHFTVGSPAEGIIEIEDSHFLSTWSPASALSSGGFSEPHWIGSINDGTRFVLSDTGEPLSMGFGSTWFNLGLSGYSLVGGVEHSGTTLLAGTNEFGGGAFVSENNGNWNFVDLGGFRPVGTAFAEGAFVIAGNELSSSRFLVSTNPEGSWTSVASPISPLLGMSGGTNIFVATGIGSQIAISSNALNWSTVSLSSFAIDRIPAVIYGNNRFVLLAKHVGTNSFSTLVSSNGVHWARKFFGVQPLNSIAFGNGHFLIAASSGPEPGASALLYSSTNGLDWVQQTIDARALTSVGFAGGRFLVVAEDGSVFVSAVPLTTPNFGGDIRFEAETGVLQLKLQSSPGQVLEIQMSEDFSSWTAAQSVTNTTGTNTLRLLQPSDQPYRFYRSKAIR